MLNINSLHPVFAAEVIGLNLHRPLARDEIETIKQAFERYSVLVFRDQNINDEEQITFSRNFGELEATKVGTVGSGSALVVLTNMDADGNILPQTSRQVLNGKANQQWHTDSSFKKIAAKASILSARALPTQGGETEFLSMRAAYASLDTQTKAQLENKIAIHDYAYGRSKIDPDLVSDAERETLPPVRQTMVLDHGVYGKSLYLGAHCATIEGMSDRDARTFIDDLMDHALNEAHIYRHQWKGHDLVMWDNRALLHRATPFNGVQEKRLMVRTTIAGEGPTLSQNSDDE